MTTDSNMAQANHPGAPEPFVVHYSRGALAFLFAFGGALAAFGYYLHIESYVEGLFLVPVGLIVMAHGLRYLAAPRLVTILPTGLVYHGMVKSYRADWSEISRVGAGQGEEAADSITFHATGPFGVFGKFAINELLIGGPNGDLASIAAALDRARNGTSSTPQFGKRRPLTF